MMNKKKMITGCALSALMLTTNVSPLFAQENRIAVVEQTKTITPEELDAAKEALEKAQSDFDQLEENIDTVQKEIDQLSQNISQYEKQIDTLNGEITTLRKDLELAEQNWEEANQAYEEAKISYDTLSSPDAQKQMEEELEQTQKELVLTKEEEQSAKEKYEQAVKIREDLETSIKEQSQKVEQKQKEINELTAQKEEKEQVIQEARETSEEASNQIDGAYEAWQNAIETAEAKKQELEQAEANIRSLEEEIQTTEQSIAEVEQQIKDLEEQGGIVSDETANSMRGFFASIGADDAISFLDEANGLSLDELKTSLNYIIECNELRKQEGLGELKVSSTMMAIAWQQASASGAIFNETGNLEHTKLNNVGENLAVTGGNPFGAWYEDEKKVYDYLQEHDLTIEQVNKNSELKKQIANELGISVGNVQVGHYENIINPAYKYAGFAMVDVVWPGLNIEGTLFGQTFSRNETYAANAMSVSEYMAKLDAYIASLEGSGSSTDALREKLETLKAELADLQSQKTNAEGQVTTAQNAYTQAQSTAVQKEQKYNTLQQTIESCQNTIETKNKELASIKTGISEKEDQKEELEKTLTELKDSLSTAQTDENKKKTDYENIQEKTTFYEKKIEEIQWSIDHLPEAVEQAKEELDKAEEKLDDLNEKTEQIQNKLNQKQGEQKQVQTEMEKDIQAKKDKTQELKDLEKEMEAAEITLEEARTDYEAILDQLTKFSDVPESAWFYDAVNYVNIRYIMTGMKEGYFGATSILSRAQFATILYRMSGSEPVEYEKKYPDVPQGTFYTDAVMWASKNGIITGYTEGPSAGRFGASDSITREQMAVMMYRYARFMGVDTSYIEDVSTFPDGKKTSEFAREALGWAIGSGLITGNADGTLVPQGTASRAVCATIIMRYIKK